MKESLKILQHESVNAMQLTHRTMFSGCCAAAETDSSDRGSNLRRLTEGKSPVSARSCSCSCSCCCCCCCCCCCGGGGGGGGRGRPGGGCHLITFLSTSWTSAFAADPNVRYGKDGTLVLMSRLHSVSLVSCHRWGTSVTSSHQQVFFQF